MPFRLILLVLVFVLPASSSAQIIQGQVLDSISGIPVDRGFIVLVDQEGMERARILTSTEGRFTLQAPGPGTYRIRSERIGFRVWESAALDVRAGAVYDLNPRVNQIPRRLATINVAGETACEDRKGPDTGLLWEEARKALVAASWSAEQEMYVHRLHRYEQVLDRSRESLSEEISVVMASSQLPFVSTDPAKLADAGYVQWEEEDGAGEWIWWGPDANVFLDPSFHETHCFWTVLGEAEHPGLVGLSFEPVPDRTVPEVEGTLWLDAESAELRFIEFGYRNVANNVSTRNIGGRAEFRPMPSGAWILDRWHITIPEIRTERRRPRIVGYRAAGGTVIEAYDTDGELVYESPDLVVLRGTVYDSTTGTALQGEHVLINNTEYASATSEDGAFEMRVLLNGQYAVTSRHIEWYGYEPGRFTYDFSPGDTVRVDLAVPSVLELHRNLCSGAPPDSNRVVHGLFRTHEGTPAAKARVTATWEPGIRRRYETDEDGRYVLCDLPNALPITVTVEHDELEFDPLRLEFIGRDILVGSDDDMNSFYVPHRIVRLVLEASPPGN
jgi:hypothetical protein